MHSAEPAAPAFNFLAGNRAPAATPPGGMAIPVLRTRRLTAGPHSHPQYLPGELGGDGEPQLVFPIRIRPNCIVAHGDHGLGQVAVVADVDRLAVEEGALALHGTTPAAAARLGQTAIAAGSARVSSGQDRGPAPT
ncbi:MAG: hypothetical protein ACLQI7_01805 [Streptosporangiaceae bacterium]